MSWQKARSVNHNTYAERSLLWLQTSSYRHFVARDLPLAFGKAYGMDEATLLDLESRFAAVGNNLSMLDFIRRIHIYESYGCVNFGLKVLRLKPGQQQVDDLDANYHSITAYALPITPGAKIQDLEPLVEALLQLFIDPVRFSAPISKVHATIPETVFIDRRLHAITASKLSLEELRNLQPGMVDGTLEDFREVLRTALKTHDFDLSIKPYSVQDRRNRVTVFDSKPRK